MNSEATRATPGARQTLPSHLTSFVGRERELAELERLAGTCRLLTLTGPGGCGKTRLALEFATRLTPTYPDGISVVSLAPLADPSLVLSTIAETVGAREVTGEPLSETIVRAIGERRVLLVLDNFEHLIEAAMAVADLLAACPRLTAIVTSREVLRLQGEQVFPVPSLSVPDRTGSPPSGVDVVSTVTASEAGRLFVERARSVQPGFQLDPTTAVAIAEICARLDGLPLAIELAAARVRLLTPQAMVDRLDRRLPFLMGGARDLPHRQQTLRDTIAWSHDLLDEDERRLFRRLSVFMGGFTLGAGSWVSGFGDDEDAPVLLNTQNLAPKTFDVVASLVDKSLIVQQAGLDGEPRFTMLETICEFAVEQLQAAGEEAAVRRRHLSWFTAFAERFQPGTFGPDGPLWLDRVAAELDNLRAALAWSLTDARGSSAHEGLRLAGALQQFWLFRDHLAEGAYWLEQVLALDAARGGGGHSDGNTDAPVIRTGAHGLYPRVIALNSLSILLAMLGRREAGIARCHEALACARSLNDPPGEAHALTTLVQYLPSSASEQRRTLAEQSVSIARRLNEPFATCRSLRAFGALLIVRGDRERARVVLEESLAVARSLGFVWQAGQSARELATLARIEGDFDQATTLIEESLSWYTKLGPATWGRRHALQMLGHLVLARGQVARATACFAESLGLSYRAGDRFGVAISLEGLSEMLMTDSPAVTALSTGQAAKLLGAAAGLREGAARSVSPVEQSRMEKLLSAVRASLPDDEFASAWAEGRAMTLEQAYALGISVTSSLSPAERTAGAADRPVDVEDGGLTRREREIAALVATGHTNRQIADALVLSGRTVETHVHNILTKLELSTRAQIAVWATERGLGAARRQ
jgi:predicted ATPase/DNA-binding NarL/FixJ family response regulator